MSIRRWVAVCAAMIVAGTLFCGAAALQVDMPSRLAVDEGYDPQAQLPPGYVLTNAEPPAAADDSGNGPDPLIDATSTPAAAAVAGASAPVQPSATPIPPTATPIPAAALPPLPNTINFILLGSDHRAGSSDWRTDTMVVVMVDPRNKQAGVISIPRDMFVNIPGRPPNRVNTLDEFGGPPLVKQVIGSLLGVPIDYYARVDFLNFEKAVNTIGGIDVSVDCTLRESNIVYPAGMTHMDGSAALLYARLRYSTSVYDRMRRQSRVLWAIREKLLSPAMFSRIPELWAAGQNMVQTDVPAQEAVSLAALAGAIKPADIHGMVVDYSMVRHATSAQGWWILLPDLNHIRIAAHSIFSPGTPSFTDVSTKKASAC